jgi:hypothetical protein
VLFCVDEKKHTDNLGRHGNLQGGFELVVWYVVNMSVPSILLIGKEDDGCQAGREDLRVSER